MKHLKKVATNDHKLNQIQNNMEQAITPVLDKAIIDGILLKDIAITTGSVDIVDHKLGRTPLGYIVVKRSANSVIWDSATNSRSISLNCSANVTINLWIF